MASNARFEDILAMMNKELEKENKKLLLIENINVINKLTKNALNSIS